MPPACCPRPTTICSFDFYGTRAQRHAEAARTLEARASAASTHDLGDAVGKLYVKQYFPASSKAQVQARWSTNILAAFDERIDTLDWMTPATKQKAKAKVATVARRRRLSGHLARLFARWRSARTTRSATRSARS